MFFDSMSFSVTTLTAAGALESKVSVLVALTTISSNPVAESSVDGVFSEGCDLFLSLDWLEAVLSFAVDVGCGAVFVWFAANEMCGYAKFNAKAVLTNVMRRKGFSL
jgi:hypothetical protein